MSNKTELKRIDADKQLIITRKFNAPLQLVWEAFTTKELMEQWWAPKPYQCVIKSMDFSEGGKLHYYMLSPEGDKHWCMAEYLTINSHQNYTANDAFCDENLVINTNFPSTHWNNEFKNDGDNTIYQATLSYATIEDMEKIISLGFKEGFDMGLNQLEELLLQLK